MLTRSCAVLRALPPPSHSILIRGQRSRLLMLLSSLYNLGSISNLTDQVHSHRKECRSRHAWCYAPATVLPLSTQAARITPSLSPPGVLNLTLERQYTPGAGPGEPPGSGRAATQLRRPRLAENAELWKPVPAEQTLFFAGRKTCPLGGWYHKEMKGLAGRRNWWTAFLMTGKGRAAPPAAQK